MTIPRLAVWKSLRTNMVDSIGLLKLTSSSNQHLMLRWLMLTERRESDNEGDKFDIDVEPDADDPEANARDFIPGRRITLKQYYSYYLVTRKKPTGEIILNPIHYAKYLMHQYAVDAFCKIEAHNLNYIRTH